jgi:hypothetical protein
MTTAHKIGTTPILAAAIVMASAASSSAETLIGRWCDHLIPNNVSYNAVITILLGKNGTIRAEEQFSDGSLLNRELREEDDGVFAVIDSEDHDVFRIVPSTGHLQLLDSEGLIRTASRLAGDFKPADCNKR